MVCLLITLLFWYVRTLRNPGLQVKSKTFYCTKNSDLEILECMKVKLSQINPQFGDNFKNNISLAPPSLLVQYALTRCVERYEQVSLLWNGKGSNFAHLRVDADPVCFETQISKIELFIESWHSLGHTQSCIFTMTEIFSRLS